MPFSNQDYIDAARHLKLDPSQVLPGTYLRSQFTNLENIDIQLGEDIKVSYVQDVIINLNVLESQLDVGRLEDETLGIKSFKVDKAFDVTYADQTQGSLFGVSEQYNKYLKDLKRELGYEFETDFNKQVGAMIV